MIRLRAYNYILDLIFCTDQWLIVDKSKESLVPKNLYYSALNIRYSFSACIFIPICDTNHSFYNFRLASYRSVHLFLLPFNWYSTLFLYEIDSVINIFYDALHKSVIDFVAQFCFSESSYPPCFNRDLKR